MAEYIDKQAFIDYMMGTSRYFTVKFDIESFPTADVAPVRHGRWEEASDGDGIVCPFCRTDFCTIVYETEHFNYCPNCGAKMDEKEDKHENYT